MLISKFVLGLGTNLLNYATLVRGSRKKSVS